MVNGFVMIANGFQGDVLAKQHDFAYATENRPFPVIPACVSLRQSFKFQEKDVATMLHAF